MIDKYEYFNLKKYTCPVPPVPTTWWSTQDWINWIDLRGKWLV